MQINSLLRYLWFALMVGILCMLILRGSSHASQVVVAYDSSRWGHFLLYGMVVAIPFAVIRKRTGLWLPLSIVLATIVAEFAQTLVQTSSARAATVLPEMFGLGAGILLGLNLRKIRTPARSEAELIREDSRSA